MNLAEATWPRRRLGELLDLLVHRTFQESALTASGAPGAVPEAGAEQDRWVATTAAARGAEAIAFDAKLDELEAVMRGAAPAVLRLDGGRSFAALVGGGRRHVRLLTADATVRRVATEELISALRKPVEDDHGSSVEEILASLSLDPGGRAAARSILLDELTGDDRLALGWLLRLSPRCRFRDRLREAGAGRLLGAFIAAHGAHYLVWLGSWWLIGRGALSGRVDPGWMLAWALLLSALVPLRLAAAWFQRRFSLVTGGVLRQHLLDGALHLSPDAIRHQGTGALLGRVIESESLENMALNGGMAAAAATLEIAIAAVVLSLGVTPVAHLVALLVALLALAGLGRSFFRRQEHWTDLRLDLTEQLVEGLVGHRTLALQQPRRLWHREEDRGLAAYYESCAAMDRGRVALGAVPRAWLLVAVGLLLPSFVTSSVSIPALAVSLGGALLIYRALHTMVVGLAQLTSARISWRRISDLFQALEAPHDAASRPERTAASSTKSVSDSLVEAHGVSYAYGGDRRTVLSGCELEIRSGDRVLLQGPSGGGKSTLAAILSGLRTPTSGVVMVDGLDHHCLTLEQWRRRVIPVPQFHENHVLTETFLFNLLMGRRWPPRSTDVEEARQVCRELGLGPLLDKMPGGLSQMVGESGWRLSHGEQSRLFIARALLQGAELLILDESFGALDPESLERAMGCVDARADALLVIAHP